MRVYVLSINETVFHECKGLLVLFGQQPAVYHLFGYETQTGPIKYKTINVQCLVKIGKQILEYFKLSSAEILYVCQYWSTNLR